MAYRSMFTRDIFSEFERLQRELQNVFDAEPNIRGIGRGGFPALNVGGTPHTLELYAFAPGLNPDSIEVNLERGVLTISGERENLLPRQENETAIHINERFSGRFRRVISLPEDDVNPSGVSAEYRDGVLHMRVKRREVPQPRRIIIQ